jgi:hypothetical protein
VLFLLGLGVLTASGLSSHPTAILSGAVAMLTSLLPWTVVVVVLWTVITHWVPLLEQGWSTLAVALLALVFAVNAGSSVLPQFGGSGSIFDWVSLSSVVVAWLSLLLPRLLVPALRPKAPAA